MPSKKAISKNREAEDVKAAAMDCIGHLNDLSTDDDHREIRDLAFFIADHLTAEELAEVMKYFASALAGNTKR